MADTTFGIDLGAYYSSIAFINESGEPEIIPSIDGEPTTPSLVYFAPESPGQTIAAVGESAKQMFTNEPEWVIPLDKRKLCNSKSVSTLPNGRTFSSVEVSGIILKKLLKDAESRTGMPTISEAALACPAWFGTSERCGLLESARQAGLNAARLIDEPVALIRAYLHSTGEVRPQTIVVFNLDGGLEVSVVRVCTEGREEDIEIVAVGGNSHLGCGAWDAALVELLDMKWKVATGLDGDGSPSWRAKLHSRAEQTRKMLSFRTTARIQLDPRDGECANVEVTRKEFEAATEPALEQAVAVMEFTLAEAARKECVETMPFDTILCTGAGLLMPKISERLRNEFGKPLVLMNSAGIVAKGVALAALNKGVQNSSSGCVLSKSYGLIVARGGAKEKGKKIVWNMLLKNQPLNTASQSYEFRVSDDGFRRMEVQVIEHEAGWWKNSSLGLPEEYNQDRILSLEDALSGIIYRVVIELPPGMMRGEAIRIRFSADSNGLVNISGVVAQTGEKLKIIGGFSNVESLTEPVDKDHDSITESQFFPNNELKNEDGNIYGIDLGSCYSSIAFINESGKPEIIPNMDGETTTPSFVFFEFSSPDCRNIVVGESAKERICSNPEWVVPFDKAKLGDRDFSITLPDGTTWGSIEVAGMILSKLAKDATEVLAGILVKQVVIGCPAWFGAAERQTLRLAAEWAGLEVVDFVIEPFAVVAAYCGRIEHPENVLVFDFGGVSLDVSVVTLLPPGSETIVEVVAIGGESRLGGANWDLALAEILAQKWSVATGENCDLLLTGNYRAELLQLAEKSKGRLTRRIEDSVRISPDELPGAVVDVTREEFETATARLMELSVHLAKETLIKAAKNECVAEFKVDTILCAGGGSMMPQVADCIEREFGMRPHIRDPRVCIAKGVLAFSQWKLERPLGNIPASLLPKSYGILVKHMLRDGCIEDVVSNVLLRRQKIENAHCTRDFRISRCGMESIEIDVVENESGCWDNMEFAACQEREIPLDEVMAPIVHHVAVELPPKLPAGESITVIFAAIGKAQVSVTAVLKKTWSPLKVAGGSIVATLPETEDFQ